MINRTAFIGNGKAALVVTAWLMAGCAGASIDKMHDKKILDGLCSEYWEGHLKAHPEEATSIGDRRYDDRLTDISSGGRAAEKTRLLLLREQIRAFPVASLSRGDRVTLASLRDGVENGLARASCEFETWVVDPLRGPQVGLLNLVAYHKVSTPEQGQGMVSRWKAMGPYVDAHMANLRVGIDSKRVAVRVHVEKSLGQLDDLLGTPVAEWPLLKPLEEPHEDWTEEERKAFREGLTAAVQGIVRPAFERYRKFLQEEILPVARSPERPGVMHLSGGKEAYKRMIRVHTSLDRSAEDLHKIGLEEVAKINAEMSVLGKKVFGTDDRKEIVKRLRSDLKMHFATRDEVESKAREALARAEAAMPEWFGILPEAPCVVERMPEYEEEDSTIAYYREPAADGSRPGTYMINTYLPESRPRYEAEALAFHEAIPGHHLQIAISQELKDVPEFRKHLGFTAFVEGWALYTERLSDEMGLYTSDLDRLGMLSYDSWRACRLVVDTGMHALGWTRQEAIDYMRENTALAENNIANEVDRYITWPGQALAYKVGQLEIFRLRADARSRLGDRFDMKWFHDRILENGAVSLKILEEELDEAINEM